MAVSVLHVYRTYFPDSPGGLQEAVRQIAIATRSFGVSPSIFALSPSPAPPDLTGPEGVVHRSRSWMAPASCDLGGIDAFRKFGRLAHEADVIHYHFPWPFADLLHLTVCPDVPAVMTYHSDIVRQRWLGAAYAPLMWRMLRNMRAVVATSAPYARTSRVLSDPCVAGRVQVIPLAIDESSYPERGDDDILRRIGVDGRPFFLFVGVLRYYKGLHTLVEAAKSVNAVIVIAGAGPEGERLQRQAASIGAGNVMFAGRISDEEKVTLLQSCVAVVLPSHLRSEAYGMVLVEAAMFGKPMVSCEIGTGTSFVNLDGVTGMVVPAESPCRLAGAMNSILADNELARDLGTAARRRYEELFSEVPLGQAYAKLYSAVAT